LPLLVFFMKAQRFVPVTDGKCAMRGGSMAHLR
jgi:hypothetical protein